MGTYSPIKIFRGDDTDAFGLRTITITLSGDLDLENATASFTLLNYTKEWTNAITKTGVLTMSMTAEDTAKFPLGMMNGTLRLFDSGKQMTVVNTIPFEITNKVFGTPTQEYDLNVTLAVDTEINIKFEMSSSGGGAVSWYKIQNKPALNKLVATSDPTIYELVAVTSADASKVAAVDSLAESATGDQVIAKVNELIATLK